jgi:hypothetical protein
MHLLSAICLIACLLLHLLVAAQDLPTDPDFNPLESFCRRFAHQTTTIDRRVYIDGGYVNYGGSVTPSTVNYTNTYLLYLDLDNLKDTFPVEWANLSKPSTVPSVVGGTLWPDVVNKYFFLYGGETNSSTPPPAEPYLWRYDVLKDTWDALDKDSSIPAVSFGAAAVADDRGEAYYYGGWQNNGTALGWSGEPLAQTGLILYNMLDDTWHNYTWYDDTPRAEGVMLYIPAGGEFIPRQRPNHCSR